MINHLYQDPHDPNARLVLGDLTDASRLVTLIEKTQLDGVYHLGVRSHVRMSFDEPEYTGNTTGVGTTLLLDAIRMVGVNYRTTRPPPRRCSARLPAAERGRFYPRSPYGAAKLYGY